MIRMIAEVMTIAMGGYALSRAEPIQRSGQLGKDTGQ